MNNITVEFNIRSTDSKQGFTTQGTFVDNIITFDDPANETNIIEIGTNQVRYQKTGQSEMDFRFEENKTHHGQYQVMNHVFEFDVTTNILTIEENKLHVEYDLYQNGEHVNKTSLTLQYAFIKEES